MKKSFYTCDRCKSIINRGELHSACVYNGELATIFSEKASWDLCRKCAKDLHLFMQGCLVVLDYAAEEAPEDA